MSLQRSASELAAGSEILVLDADPTVRAGLEQLLRESGLLVTTASDDALARRLILEKFFSVVVADLDTPAPGEGLAFVAEVKQRSPASAVVVLTARKVFEAAVRAFRSGASDIIAKAPDQVDYLRERLIELAAESRLDVDRRKILGEAHELHEEFLRRMMETARKVTDLEERLSGRSASISTESLQTTVLVADDGPELFENLQAHLPAAQGFQVRYAQTGGEALDAASNQVVHIALIKDELPDLPGTMVVRTLAKNSPGTIAVVFSQSGQAQLYDGSKVIPLDLGRGMQAVARVQELREALRAKGRERRYLQAFRAQHYEFLRRYAEFKQKLEKILKDSG
ncbi:MAG TPA: response regulator [Polyangia bacterium]|nr:response regulator [Polyangia bacterium]